jgi:hypothetical protein
MVQQRTHDHSSEVLDKSEDTAGSRGKRDQLELQPDKQDTNAAIKNWLNSRICGKAC